MKIISLQAENVKRLIAVEIRPKENLVEITGRNGAGKTSVLDSIWWALGGTKTHQKHPVRKGEMRARITLDLGNIIVKRAFRVKDDGQITTSITVEDEEGSQFKSPQKMLDELLGALSFDPLAFARMSTSDQYHRIMDMCGLDLDDLKKASLADYEERTVQNRLAKASRSAAAMIDLPETIRDDRVNVSELVELLRQGEALNFSIGEQTARKAERIELIAEEEAQVAALEIQLEDLQDSIEATKLTLSRADPIPDRFDPEPIQKAINEAGAINDGIDKAARKNEQIAGALASEELAEALTNRIDKRTRQARKMIEEADMPIEGLSLDKGDVIYNGIPLSQASDSEQLRVSCAIAMRENTKLRVIRVRDGSLLDDDSLSVLREMAVQADFQVWVERVDTSGKMGFVIEDGELKEET